MVLGRQSVLNALRVDAPARLDGDIFRPIDFVGYRHAHDAGVGLLLPQHVAGLGVVGAEHTVVGAPAQEEITSGRRHRTEQLRLREVMRPDLLSRRRIPRLQFTIMIGAGNDLQADILGLGYEPELALGQRDLLAGKTAAEILVGRNIDQAGLRTIRRRRPVLAAPQRRTEIDPLAEARLVLRVDNGLAALRLDAFPDVGMNISPAGYIVDPFRLALQDPEDRVAPRMDQALERAAVPLEVD